VRQYNLNLPTESSSWERSESGMGTEHKNRTKILRGAMVALVCATLFSMPLIGSLYAKYTTSTSRDTGVGVAAFNITQGGSIFEKTIETRVTPGTTQSEKLTITNKSEVAIEYNVKVTNTTGNIKPLKFHLQAKDGAVTTPSFTPTYETGVSENSISINKAYQAPGDHTDEYTLLIVWENSANPEDDLALMGMVDYITVTVTVTQAPAGAIS